MWGYISVELAKLNFFMDKIMCNMRFTYLPQILFSEILGFQIIYKRIFLYKTHAKKFAFIITIIRLL